MPQPVFITKIYHNHCQTDINVYHTEVYMKMTITKQYVIVANTYVNIAIFQSTY